MATPRSEPAAASGPVRSIERCFDILEMLRIDSRGASLAEISRSLHVPKSTVLTIVRTLRSRGLLAYDEQRKTYALGLGMERFAQHARRPPSLEEIARPQLEDLTHATGETCTLATAQGDAVFYSCPVQGPQLIQFVVPIGVPRPLHCTASGKLALAARDDAAVGDYARRHGLLKFTPRTITRIGALKTELEKVRRQDFATSMREISNDLFGIAGPIRDAEGRLVASVNLVGPYFRLGNRTPQLVQAVCDTARRISSALLESGGDGLGN
ncbi:MAG: IclR family transcriptional regulator [Rubrivivax sp.]|nr:IclR family transcriptional regulator [Rubrivivax sp.]